MIIAVQFHVIIFPLVGITSFFTLKVDFNLFVNYLKIVLVRGTLLLYHIGNAEDHLFHIIRSTLQMCKK